MIPEMEEESPANGVRKKGGKQGWGLGRPPKRRRNINQTQSM